MRAFGGASPLQRSSLLIYLFCLVGAVSLPTDLWGSNLKGTDCQRWSSISDNQLQNLITQADILAAVNCIFWSGNKARALRLLVQKMPPQGDSPLVSHGKHLAGIFLKEDHRRRFRSGLEDVSSGKLSEAVDIWERILREDSAHLLVWEQYVLGLEAQNVTGRLWSERERFLEHFPFSQTGRQVMVNVALRRDQVPLALEWAQPLKSQTDRRSVLLYTQALARSQLVNQAIAHLDSVYQNYPDDALLLEKAKLMMGQDGLIQEPSRKILNQLAAKAMDRKEVNYPIYNEAREILSAEKRRPAR